MYMRFPKLRGTILGVSIIRTIVFGLGGLCWGPLFRGNCHTVHRDLWAFSGVYRGRGLRDLGFIGFLGCEACLESFLGFSF